MDEKLVLIQFFHIILMFSKMLSRTKSESENIFSALAKWRQRFLCTTYSGLTWIWLMPCEKIYLKTEKKKQAKKNRNSVSLAVEILYEIW